MTSSHLTTADELTHVEWSNALFSFLEDESDSDENEACEAMYRQWREETYTGPPSDYYTPTPTNVIEITQICIDLSTADTSMNKQK